MLSASDSAGDPSHPTGLAFVEADATDAVDEAGAVASPDISLEASFDLCGLDWSSPFWLPACKSSSVSSCLSGFRRLNSLESFGLPYIGEIDTNQSFCSFKHGV